MLAMELSSRRGSIALADGGAVVDEESWEGPQARGESVFAAIDALLARQQRRAADIEVFAVGRGPGGFSGIRMAVTAAQAFALPRERRVVAVSSGAALARAVRAERPGCPVAILGDARRGTWWWSLFSAAGESMGAWRATPLAEALAQIPGEAVLATPDWDRMPAAGGSDPRWLRESHHPSAREVAALCLDLLSRGEAGEPLEPIYLHPAVQAK